jgi:hypothetical protein
MGASTGTSIEPRNHLLASLSPEDAERLGAHLERMPLPQGKVLFDAGEPLTRVYFPEDGVASLVEIPFGTFLWPRIPTSLSYFKLFGRPLSAYLSVGPLPDVPEAKGEP